MSEQRFCLIRRDVVWYRCEMRRLPYNVYNLLWGDFCPFYIQWALNTYLLSGSVSTINWLFRMKWKIEKKEKKLVSKIPYVNIRFYAKPTKKLVRNSSLLGCAWFFLYLPFDALLRIWWNMNLIGRKGLRVPALCTCRKIVKWTVDHDFFFVFFFFKAVRFLLTWSRFVCSKITAVEI